MNRTAYLVAYLMEGGVYRLGIFSEPTPTVMGPTITAVVSQTTARDYASAEKQLVKAMRTTLPKELISTLPEDVQRRLKRKRRLV